MDREEADKLRNKFSRLRHVLENKEKEAFFEKNQYIKQMKKQFKCNKCKCVFNTSFDAIARHAADHEPQKFQKIGKVRILGKNGKERFRPIQHCVFKNGEQRYGPDCDFHKIVPPDNAIDDDDDDMA